ncbi:MAG: hypothetical protein AAGB12_12795 [Pseudomonadota bacterium]
MAIRRHTQQELETMKGATNEERLNHLTEEEIEKRAQSDPDNPLLTEEQLQKFKRPSEEYRKRFQKDEH